MDKIGIKLADGSFYPILEDGTPGKKNISLTTVKDNQTTVHVDLFRSPSGTMQDAQYMDTLEIDNLNPHTNGDPNLSFDIELAEDGSISAEINDPETGRQASRKVSISSLAGTVAEKLPSRDSDLSLKAGEEIDEPIELGHHQDRAASPVQPATDDTGSQNEYVKEMEDIFKSPEKDGSEDDKADSSFDEIVNDISNIGKDADSQEDNEVIGPSPNSESFAFDDFDGGTDKKKDEFAEEPIEEISAEEAIPKDAEFVDSTGDEPLEMAEMPDTLGALDAGADQPDFGFKELADNAEADEAPSDPAEKDGGTADSDGFEELGTLPDWSTGGLDDADEDLSSLPSFAGDDTVVSADDDEKTAINDDNLDEENLELASFDAEGTDDLSEPVVQADADLTDKSLPEELPADSGTDGIGQDVDAGSIPDAEASGSLDDSDDLDKLDLPSVNLFDDGPLTESEPAKSTDDDPWAGSGAAAVSGLSLDDSDEKPSAADDFELPDLSFDDAVAEEADTDFELPDFDKASSSAYAAASSSAFDDFDSSLRSSSDWPSLDLDGDEGKAAAGSSFTPNNMFDNLYDKETMEGKSSDVYEEETRGTRVPMIVCIACAIICILCLFFLFVIPTKFNVLHRDGSQAVAMSDKRSSARPEGKSSVGGNELPEIKDAGADKEQSSAGDLIKPASAASVSAPLPKVESVPAKENEIVIASVPSVVVPETPVKNVKKIPDIQYKVVWGDTLWDIANAYYKNPWKYTVLAEYNHLKNPNFIQTGSILLIPAE